MQFPLRFVKKTISQVHSTLIKNYCFVSKHAIPGINEMKTSFTNRTKFFVFKTCITTNLLPFTGLSLYSFYASLNNGFFVRLL